MRNVKYLRMTYERQAFWRVNRISRNGRKNGGLALKFDKVRMNLLVRKKKEFVEEERRKGPRQLGMRPTPRDSRYLDLNRFQSIFNFMSLSQAVWLHKLLPTFNSVRVAFRDGCPTTFLGCSTSDPFALLNRRRFGVLGYLCITLIFLHTTLVATWINYIV